MDALTAQQAQTEGQMQVPNTRTPYTGATTLGQALDPFGITGWKAKKQAAAMQAAFNAREAQKSRVWSHNEAGLQRGFQERMSNTAMRRKMADLKAAGLNPSLAGVNQVGASSPGGAMGGTSSASMSMPESADVLSGVVKIVGMVTSALTGKAAMANAKTNRANAYTRAWKAANGK